MRSKQTDHSQLQASLVSLQTQNMNQDTVIASLKEQLNRSQKNQESLKRDRDLVVDKLADLKGIEKEKNQLEERLVAAEHQNQDLEMSAVTAKHKITELERKQSKSRIHNCEVMEQYKNTLELDRDILVTRLETAQQKVNDLEKCLERAQGKARDLDLQNRGDRLDCEKEKQRLSQELNIARQKIVEMENSAKFLTDSLKEFSTKLVSRDEYHNVQKDKELLVEKLRESDRKIHNLQQSVTAAKELIIELERQVQENKAVKSMSRESNNDHKKRSARSRERRPTQTQNDWGQSPELTGSSVRSKRGQRRSVSTSPERIRSYSAVSGNPALERSLLQSSRRGSLESHMMSVHLLPSSMDFHTPAVVDHSSLADKSFELLQLHTEVQRLKLENDRLSRLCGSVEQQKRESAFLKEVNVHKHIHTLPTALFSSWHMIVLSFTLLVSHDIMAPNIHLSKQYLLIILWKIILSAI